MDTCGRHGGFMQTLRHLVVGTDFSQPAEQALELAIRLARADGGWIT
jgi:hypothetical protein